jgi:hypothetical protein
VYLIHLISYKRCVLVMIEYSIFSFDERPVFSGCNFCVKSAENRETQRESAICIKVPSFRRWLSIGHHVTVSFSFALLLSGQSSLLPVEASLPLPGRALNTVTEIPRNAIQPQATSPYQWKTVSAPFRPFL